MHTTPVPPLSLLHPFSTRGPRLMAATAAAALALTACGGSNDPTVGAASPAAPSASSTASGAAPGGIAAEHNEADITFVTQMKPHHESAIDMAELAATRADSADVKELAEQIVAAQDPEIQQMDAMAAAWGVDPAGGGSMPGMDMGGGSDMGGMDMSEEMTKLESLSGEEFDRRFLTAMTEHHRSAVEMAKVELAQGQNPQAKQMATDIVASQTAEIEKMTALLAEL